MKRKIFFRIALVSMIGLSVILSGLAPLSMSANAAANTTLYFNPASIQTTVNGDFNLDAMINPGSNQVTAVELRITFDQTKLRLDTVNASGGAFSVTLQAAAINNTNGSAAIILGVPAASPAASVTSTGKVATFSFHALAAATNSSVGIPSSSVAAAIGEAGNVVATRTAASVTIIEGSSNAPTLSITAPVASQTNDTTPSFSFTSSKAGTLLYAGSCVPGLTTVSSGTNNVTLNALSQGTYSDCKFSVIDSTGNNSATTTLASFTVDTAAPTLSSGNPSGTLAMNSTSATLSLSTNEAATCKYATTAGTAYGSMNNNFSTTNSTAHTKSLTGLANGRSYSYYVRCVDRAGNSTASDYVISFSVSSTSTTPSNNNNNNDTPSNQNNTPTTYGAPAQLGAASQSDGIKLTWANPSNTGFSKNLLYRSSGPVANPTAANLSSFTKLIYQGAAQEYLDKEAKTTGTYYYYIVAQYTNNQKSSVVSKTYQSGTQSNNSQTNKPAQNTPAVQATITTMLAEASAIFAQQNSINMDETTKAIYAKLMLQIKVSYSAKVRYSIAYFIHAGSATTKILGAGERAGVLSSFISAFGKLPETQAEWEDAIKIANGRWPGKNNTQTEQRAKATFHKIYLRDPDANNNYDQNAVAILSYGLRPAQRNMNSEAAAIKSFKFIYHKAPQSAADWDIIRTIAYSGAKR